MVTTLGVALRRWMKMEGGRATSTETAPVLLLPVVVPHQPTGLVVLYQYLLKEPDPFGTHTMSAVEAKAEPAMSPCSPALNRVEPVGGTMLMRF